LRNVEEVLSVAGRKVDVELNEIIEWKRRRRLGRARNVFRQDKQLCVV